MKALRPALVSLILIGSGIAVLSVADEESPKPERKIEHLPKSITYQKRADGKHAYSVAGIYNASERRIKESQRGIDDENPFGPLDPSIYPESIYQKIIPDCDEVKADFPNRVLRFTTSRELPYDELAKVIDELAMGGDLPYWGELEARDIGQSPAYSAENYEISTPKEEFPSGLAWFAVPRDRKISTSIHIDPWDQGTLLFIPSTGIIHSTGPCMVVHPRFSIRILDPDGLVLWEDDETALADVRFALADIDQDGLHEILLVRDDHGKEDRFLIRRKPMPQNQEAHPDQEERPSR
ncbi:MAG TPA: hypothetical protein PLA50_14940 [Bacteroidia bacterium]|nr:hypothetical protein [Bacteroidia bacterium]